MPCLRHTSAVGTPTSCSRSTAIICSSLILDRFIVRPLPLGRTLALPGGVSGGHVTGCPPSPVALPLKRWRPHRELTRLLSRELSAKSAFVLSPFMTLGVDNEGSQVCRPGGMQQTGGNPKPAGR